VLRRGGGERPGAVGAEPRLTAVVLAVGVLVLSSGCGSGSGDQPPRAAPAPAAAPSAPGSAVVVLGDSFTVGVGSSTGRGYLDHLAEDMAWSVTAAAESGTGYVSPSVVPGYQPYGGRVAELASLRPSLVVVQGSTNDVGRSAADVGRAADALYADLRTQLPGTPVVVVGPLDAPAVDPAGVRAVRDALAEAAEEAGLPFIDPIEGGWLQPPDGLYADGLHPDDQGYAEFADELAAALQDQGR